MQIELQTLKPKTVLYARAIGRYDSCAPEAWAKICDWLSERGLRDQATCGMGWFRDDPMTHDRNILRYDACITLIDGVGGDFQAGIGRQTLPGGLYAVHDLPDGMTYSTAFLRMSNDLALPRLDCDIDPDRSMIERVEICDGAQWSPSQRMMVPVVGRASFGVRFRSQVA